MASSASCARRKSLKAVVAAASLACTVPTRVHKAGVGGGNPVTVSSEPTSPLTADPVHVTPAPPSTAKFDAVPSETWANAEDGPKTSAANPMLANRVRYLH